MKKIVSIIVCVVLLISVISVPAFAESKNLLSGHIASSRGIAIMKSDGSAVSSDDKISNEMLSAVVDGNVVAHWDIPEGLTWDNPRYFGMEFTLDFIYNVEKVKIYAGFSERPEEYRVYASDKLSNLYLDESLIAENIVCNGAVAEVSVNRSVKYVSFVCTAFDGNQRVKEFEVIGTSIKDEIPINTGLFVNGNRITDADENPIQLKGVNITELSWSTFGDGSTQEGKSNADESIKKAVHEWGCGIIRLAVNTDFYLRGGTHKGVTKTAEEYRALVDKFVSYATENGVAVVFDCHAYYGITEDVISFWKIAAPKYDNNELVMFGLLNEPVSDWNIYFEGGILEISNVNTNVYGVAELLDVVRQYSDNIAVIGGIDWAFDLSKFSASDFDAFAASRAQELGISKESYIEKYYIKSQARYGRGIVLDSHPYSNKALNWDYYLKNAIAEYPVLFGEFGPVFLKDAAITHFTDSEKAYLIKAFGYIKENNLLYTAWGMNAWPYLTTPDGAVTPFGEAVKSNILGVDFDFGITENLIYTKYSSVRPVVQGENGRVYQSDLFYHQAHSNNNKISGDVAQYIIDGDTVQHYDIYPADNNIGIEYTLNGLYAGNKVVISSGFEAYPDRYKIYVSDSQDDLYNEENLIENMSVDIKGNYEFEIDRQVKYIGIIGNGYVRIKELELNGSKIGDFNYDGIINATDMISLQKKLLTNEGSNALSDVNSDKLVNLLDFVRIKKIISKKI